MIIIFLEQYANEPLNVIESNDFIKNSQNQTDSEFCRSLKEGIKDE